MPVKMNPIVKSITGLIACWILTSAILDAQQVPSEKEISRWVEKKVWANGLALDIHPTVNKDSFYVAYHRNKKLWDAAFAFLKNHNLDTLSPGKYQIAGEQVFASITESPSHNKEEVKWESHKNYVDLQYIIRGKELIGISDTSAATMIKPYTPDVINYTAEGKYYTAEQGRFFLFFPNDAHKPTIKVEGYDLVKKIVIKIQTDRAD